MKNILLLSDTHGHIDQRMLHFVKQADEVWHAGDIGQLSVTDQLANIRPLRAVFGNIDGSQARLRFPEHMKFECEGVKILMTHIGGPAGKYNKTICEHIENFQPQVFICGHSHILKVIHVKKYDLLHLNPGAAGKHGFHQIRTMLRFCLMNGKISQLEAIELGKRGAMSA